ncbi:MAG TPA: amidohydrolase [Candidatus Limnocylindrales bacterium]|nr:amidohydrolase [Candidatus Limnocylindrales bacterium]
MKPRSLPYPDTILYNGKIRTFTSETARCEALACSGSRIVATGNSDDMRRLAGPETHLIDLLGRTAIPGLTDTHVHLSEKGTAEMELVDCRDFYLNVHSIADILQRLANAAASAPKGSWLVAHGSPMQDFRIADQRFPDKHELDSVCPDNPVSISFGAHVTIANSLALAAAKISRDTPNPAGGNIKHDAQTGEPTGELHERAQLIVKKVAPEFNYLQLKDGIVFALNQCLERGVTTVHDIVRYAEPVRAYQELYKEGRMHARVSILPRVIESMIDSKSLTELGVITGFGNEWLRIGGVKMSIDGGITGRNACFHEPYENDEHNHGIIRIQQDELNHTVQVCHDAGLRCCVHAIGDKAFDMALDAYENAIEHSPRKDHRHRIEHMGNWLATPKLMQRMVRSGIVAIPNIAFAYYIGDAILDCVGEKRLTKAFPFHTLLKNHVIIAGGSDSPGYWPVDPLRDIATAASRKMRWGEVWIPEEKITVSEAFAMHTTTASWVGFEENDKGTLKVGKLADIAVLAEDPFAIEPEKIKDLKVEMTLVGGEIKYQA